MKLLKKSIGIIAALAIAVSVFCFSAAAAGTTSIQVNTRTLSVGATLDVTVNFSADEDMATVEGNLQFNNDVLEYVSSSSARVDGDNLLYLISDVDMVKTKSITVTFKAKKIGQSELKLYNCSYFKPDKITMSGDSTTVNVADTTSTTKSGNANLKNLYLSNNIPFTPAFNKDVTTYTVNVDNSVTKVLVNAVVEDADATLQVVGSSEMKVGANQRTIVVTAPNGTQKKYVLNINRAAPEGTVVTDPENPEATTVNPYEINVNNELWTLVSEYTQDLILSGFVSSSSVINSVELPVIRNSAIGTVLVYAGNADGSKKLYYIYNELTGAFTEYKLIETPASQLVILNIDSSSTLPKGYYKTTTEVGGHTAEVIRYEDAAYSDFIIVYAETLQGNKGYYRIDTLSNSVQRIPEFDAALKSAATMQGSNILTRFTALSNMEKIMVVAILLAVVIIIALVVILIVKLASSDKSNEYKVDEFEEFEELDEFDEFDEDLDNEEAEE